MSESGFEEKSLPLVFESLVTVCSVEKDRFGQRAYRLTFDSDASVTMIRVVLDDEQSGADLVITNMTMLPESARGKGMGSDALSKLIKWALSNNFKNIQAVQVQPEAETFWISNGFKKNWKRNK